MSSLSTNAPIAVVGASGFIGSALTRLLVEEGKQVHQFTRDIPFAFENLNFFEKYAAVAWCATSVNPMISRIDGAANNAELDTWSRFVIKASELKFRGLSPKIVFLSSGGCVYPDSLPPFDEQLTGTPINEYGRVKLDMENFANQFNLNLTILRLSNVYGPNQPIGVGQGVIAEWVHRLVRNMPVEIFGSLDTFRDFIFVEDAASAISLALNSRVSKTINIGCGQGVSLKFALNTIAETLNRKPLLRNVAERGIDRYGYWLDISLAKSTLGWAPKTDFRSGIRKVVDFELLQSGVSGDVLE